MASSDDVTVVDQSTTAEGLAGATKAKETTTKESHSPWVITNARGLSTNNFMDLIHPARIVVRTGTNVRLDWSSTVYKVPYEIPQIFPWLPLKPLKVYLQHEVRLAERRIGYVTLLGTGLRTFWTGLAAGTSAGGATSARSLKETTVVASSSARISTTVVSSAAGASAYGPLVTAKKYRHFN